MRFHCCHIVRIGGLNYISVSIVGAHGESSFLGWAASFVVCGSGFVN